MNDEPYTSPFAADWAASAATTSPQSSSVSRIPMGSDFPVAPNDEHFTSPYALNPVTVSDAIIKVVGVGGGGCNAVNHMFDEGIHDVSFAVCNTDAKALADSPVRFKLQLGREGLGAGNKPENGRKAVEESLDAVKEMLSDGTKMVFITAGMGGGTGTGAAPVIARVAKDLGLLTVGIVTIPFKWEGNLKIDTALDGVEEMQKNVDALLVVNNQRLLEIYPNQPIYDSFDIADDTLCNAARSISGIITMHGRINLDFQDVRTILKDGGVAIINSGVASGDGRVKKAIDNALNSPLLKEKEFYKSRKVLLHIIEPGRDGTAPLMTEEVAEVTAFMNQMQEEALETKWGLSSDPALQDKVKVTILASGFQESDIDSDELTERLDQREAEARRLQQIKDDEEARLAHRRDAVYGTEDKTGLKNKAVHWFEFETEDLDNDDVISAVEGSATYSRTRNSLKQLSHSLQPRMTVQQGDTINLSD